MGTTYTVYMLDEYYFDYATRSPDDVINKIKERFPYSSPLQYGNTIVFDAHKNDPENDDFAEFLYSLCDAVYYQRDNNCNMTHVPRPPS